MGEYMAKVVSKSTAKKVDPFKTKKTKTEASDASDTISPPKEVAEAIDAFRECQDQAKHFEGEATIHKDKIVEYCQDSYIERLTNGQGGSFKVLGDETMVTFVTMDSSAGLTDEDFAEIRERFGDACADALVEKDFRSIRFNDQVLSANYDEVVAALEALPEQILANLFKPMLMKAKPGAADIAKKYAKKPGELKELLGLLKMKQYIR